MNGRTPPQALEVEAAVLGAALVDPRAATALLATLAPGHFYDPRHRAVCRAIAAVNERGQRPDLVSVCAALRDDDANVQQAYVSHLTTTVATTDAASVEQHARIVFEKALLRESIDAMQDGLAAAFDTGADPYDVLESLQRTVTQQLAAPRARRAPRSAPPSARR